MKEEFISKKDYDKNFGRDIKTITKYQLWVKYHGKCAFCGESLFNLENENHLNKQKNKYWDTHSGQLAHIVSAKMNLRSSQKFYKATIKEYGKNISENKVVDFKNKNKKNEKKQYFYFNQTDKNIPFGYSWDFLRDEKNLILLCKDCHSIFDEKNKEKFTNNLPEIMDEIRKHKDSNEQIKFIYEATKKILNGFKDKTFHPLFIAFCKNDLKNISDMLFDNDVLKNYKIRFNFNSFNDLSDYKYQLINNYETKTLVEIKKEKFLKDFLELLPEDNIKNNEQEQNNKIELKVLKIDQNHYESILINIVEQDKFDLKANFQQTSELKEKLKTKFKNLNNEKINFLNNNSNPIEELKEKPDYKIIKNILLKELYNFTNKENKKEVLYFDSFSVAYMARWGTGKTTLIRTITQELKDFYNYVEINLWNIANSLSNMGVGGEDNVFVRQIVKESITQLINDPKIVSNFIDSTASHRSTSEKHDLKEKMLSSILKMPNKGNEINILKERQKFLDQFITSLSDVLNTIFDFTKKPTIFVFDDLDRINDSEKIVAILDSIVAFLNLKNAVYIIPVDESKVMKAISEIKPENNPYSYMNKYFTYSIRASFIPKVDTYALFQEIYQKLKEENEDLKIHEDNIKMIANIIAPTYRAIKDFINNYLFNKFTLSKINLGEAQNYFDATINKIKIPNWNREKKKNFIILLATIIQMKFPLLIDFFSKELKNVRTFCLEGIKPKNIFNSFFEESFFSELKKEKDKPEEMIEMIESLLITKVDQSANSDTIETFFNLPENKRILIKKRYKQILSDAATLFKTFKIAERNLAEQNDFIIALWMATTLANIKDNDTIKYLRLSEIKEILVNKNDEDFKKKFLEIKEDKGMNKKILEFIKSISEFKNKGLLQQGEFENIIKKIMNEEMIKYLKQYETQLSDDEIIFFWKELWEKFKTEQEFPIYHFINTFEISNSNYSKILEETTTHFTEKEFKNLIDNINNTKKRDIFIKKINLVGDGKEKMELERDDYTFDSILTIFQKTNFSFVKAPSVTLNLKNEEIDELEKFLEKLNQENLFKIAYKNKYENFYLNLLTKDINLKAIEKVIQNNKNSWFLLEILEKMLQKHEAWIYRGKSPQSIVNFFILFIDWSENTELMERILKTAKNIQVMFSSLEILIDNKKIIEAIVKKHEIYLKESKINFLKYLENYDQIFFQNIFYKKLIEIFYKLELQEKEIKNKNLLKSIFNIQSTNQNFDLSIKIMEQFGFQKLLAYNEMPYYKDATIYEIMKYNIKYNNQEQESLRDSFQKFFDRKKPISLWLFRKKQGFNALTEIVNNLWTFAQNDLRLFPLLYSNTKSRLIDFEKFVSQLSLEKIENSKRPIEKTFLNFINKHVNTLEEKIRKIINLDYHKKKNDLKTLNLVKLDILRASIHDDINQRLQKLNGWSSYGDVHYDFINIIIIEEFEAEKEEKIKEMKEGQNNINQKYKKQVEKIKKFYLANISIKKIINLNFNITPWENVPIMNKNKNILEENEKKIIEAEKIHNKKVIDYQKNILNKRFEIQREKFIKQESQIKQFINIKIKLKNIKYINVEFQTLEVVEKILKNNELILNENEEKIKYIIKKQKEEKSKN